MAQRTNSILMKNGRTGSTGSNGEDPHISKLDPKLKKQQLEQWQVRSERARRDNEEARKKAEATYSCAQNIVMPKYRHDDLLDIDREVDAPPPQTFIGLGWDEDKETQRKHYRRYYPEELEKIRELMPRTSPFNQYDLRRG